MNKTMNNTTQGKTVYTPWPRIDFVDYNEAPCVIKQDVCYPNDEAEFAVMLGLRYARPVVMASDAAKVGVETTETVGWVPYPLPDEVHIPTKMRLDRAKIETLIETLQFWLNEWKASTTDCSDEERQADG